jgi:hypothetical protein
MPKQEDIKRPKKDVKIEKEEPKFKEVLSTIIKKKVDIKKN